MASGPIDAKTTQTEYIQGEQILLIGSTNPNALLKVALIDPNGVKLKNIEIPSNSEGSFTVDKFKIPTNAIVGKWKIEVNSGSNSDTVEFEVNSTDKDGIIIKIGEITKIPGFGKSAVITGDSSLIKVHIHVLDTAPIIKYANEIGKVENIFIQNMDEQAKDISNSIKDYERLLSLNRYIDSLFRERLNKIRFTKKEK